MGRGLQDEPGQEIEIEMDKEMHEELLALAKKNNMTFDEYVNWCVRQALDAWGIEDN